MTPGLAANCVLLMWFVPGMVRADMSGAANLAATLQKYVVVMVVHGHLDKASGTFSFEDIDTLEAKDQAGKSLNLLARSDMPPAPTAVLAAVEAMFRQALGAMGKGAKMFVFDAADVEFLLKRAECPFRSRERPTRGIRRFPTAH